MGRHLPRRAGRSADHERLEACCRICDLVPVAVALHHPDVQLGSVEVDREEGCSKLAEPRDRLRLLRVLPSEH